MKYHLSGVFLGVVMHTGITVLHGAGGTIAYDQGLCSACWPTRRSARSAAC